MLQNAHLLAKIGADTAENELKFADNLPKIGNYPAGSTRRAVGPPRAAGPLSRLQAAAPERWAGPRAAPPVTAAKTTFEALHR